MAENGTDATEHMEEYVGQNGVPIAHPSDEWAKADETLQQLLAQDTAQERKAWNWQLMAFAAMGIAIGLLAIALWAILTRPDVVPFVQVVQVDDTGTVVNQGDPTPLEQYTPQDGQWVQMLSEWVLRMRWRGVDQPQAQQAWRWLEMYTCGPARQQLQEYAQVERPMERLGVVKRQLDIKNVVKSDMPHAWTVIWEEVEVVGPQAPVKSTNSGTFTVGRRSVESAAMRLANPFGLCTTAYHWGVQP